MASVILVVRSVELIVLHGDVQRLEVLTNGDITICGASLAATQESIVTIVHQTVVFRIGGLENAYLSVTWSLLPLREGNADIVAVVGETLVAYVAVLR